MNLETRGVGLAPEPMDGQYAPRGGELDDGLRLKVQQNLGEENGG
jgi:hypothetical protein